MNTEQLITVIVAAVLLPMLAYGIKYGVAYLQSKADAIENEIFRNIIKEAISSVEQAVLYVMQTYVDGLKTAGKFDKEAQAEALLKAKEAASELISSEAQAAIEAVYGDFDTWLSTRIEQTVRATKLERK